MGSEEAHVYYYLQLSRFPYTVHIEESLARQNTRNGSVQRFRGVTATEQIAPSRQ